MAAESALQAIARPDRRRCQEALHFASPQRQGRASSVPLQRSRRSPPHTKRRNLGLQPHIHAIHPAVHLRPADLDGRALHLRLGLLQCRRHREFLQQFRRTARDGTAGSRFATADKQ